MIKAAVAPPTKTDLVKSLSEGIAVASANGADSVRIGVLGFKCKARLLRLGQLCLGVGWGGKLVASAGAGARVRARKASGSVDSSYGGGIARSSTPARSPTSSHTTRAQVCNCCLFKSCRDCQYCFPEPNRIGIYVAVKKGGGNVGAQRCIKLINKCVCVCV